MRAPRDEDAERADDHHTEEVDPVERVDALIRPEDDESGSLHPGGKDEPGGEPDPAARDTATDGDVGHDDEAEEGESERTEPDRENRRDDGEAVAVQLEKLQRREHRREAE